MYVSAFPVLGLGESASGCCGLFTLPGRVCLPPHPIPQGLDNLPHDLQQLLPPGVFWVSSQDNRGIDRLKALIVENLSAF